ncbi:hypothetical protein [Pseudescherichia sp.]|uniref:hypothetical protein n=1 Tax=Pseudescherichia sp. TaxID=2055881 RepID=UPI0028B084BA|nr:hypothetical protein [Pseudescherichia sp.]
MPGLSTVRYLKLLILISTLVTGGAYAAAQSSSLACKQGALNASQKLLAFYRDNDDRIVIDDKVTPLAKIKNPANEKQLLNVLETWGYIYKGRYRMRLIFSSDCILMGEEILEYANL